MKRALTVIAVTAIAGGIAGTTVFAAPSRTTKTLTFVAVQNGSRQIDKTHYIAADKDQQNGKVIGFDSLSCVVTSTGKSANCNVAASYKGGILYGSFTQQFSNGSLTGTVTGGTRQFNGATGTITGTAVSQTKEKVTVTYST